MNLLLEFKKIRTRLNDEDLNKLYQAALEEINRRVENEAQTKANIGK